MKTSMKIGSVAVMAAIVGGCVSDDVPQYTLDRSKFNIGAYYLKRKAGEKMVSEEQLRDFRDCGMTFVCDGGVRSREELDRFEKYGVMSLPAGVVPGTPNFKNSGTMSEKTPVRKIERAVARWLTSDRQHPAICGIDVGDEPSALDFQHIGKCVRRMQELMPNYMLYLNLYPSYASSAKDGRPLNKSQLGARSYAEYIDEYCREIPLDYISWDYYVYSNDGLLPGYYNNMRIVADACRRTGKDLWFIPQVNTRLPKYVITEQKLRFQVNTALSFGAVQIIWACYSPGWWTNNVLTAAGEKTEQYGKLRKINAELRGVTDEYMRFKSVGTHFVGYPNGSKDIANVPVEPVGTFGNKVFFDVHADDGDRLVIGEMAARDGGDEKAIYVTATDDPFDKAPKVRTVRFRLPETRTARVVSGSGEIELKRDAFGNYTFDLRSSCGALVIAE